MYKKQTKKYNKELGTKENIIFHSFLESESIVER